jgi:hypothetical protein
MVRKEQHMKRRKMPQQKVDEVSKELFGNSQADARAKKRCVKCNSGRTTSMHFSDYLSWREYEISGMCEQCQDEVFGHGSETTEVGDEDGDSAPTSPVKLLICSSCGRKYDPRAHDESHYFDPPWDYSEGCSTYCLSCWLDPDWMEREAKRRVSSENDEPETFREEDIPF